ncbi:hypothetical protein ABW20_dc0104395 [Dactylellina cionopaga]|nr:hypothetical protein ABW20_dc0104395 [Dactylellina cionopaga]
MARPVDTTILTTISISTEVHAPRAHKSTKRNSLPKKNKSSYGDTIDLTGEDDGDGSSFEYLTVWRHRLQLNIPTDDVARLNSHLETSLTDPRVMSTVTTTTELNQLEKSISITLISTPPEGTGSHLLTANVPIDGHGRMIHDLLAKFERGKKMQDIFKVTWSLLPLVLSAAKPYCTIEFDIRKRDSYIIDWKAEKWLSSFLALTTAPPSSVFSISQLRSVLDTTGSTKGDIKPRDFYKSVYVPPATTQVPEMIQVSELTTQMFPFQMRTVNWMMEREGVTAANGTIQSLPATPSMQGLCIQETEDFDGRKMWTSVPLTLTTTNKQALENTANIFRVRGGILAEEMGLGKTVELISLLSLHKREIPEGKETIYDTYSGAEVRASPSTLIICPPSIMQQWVNELSLHAPGLRVLKYSGTRELLQQVYRKKNSKNGKVSNEKYMELSFELQSIPNSDLVDHLLQYDIVLSTYNVLANEIYYAERPPDRSLRHEKKYERRSCPLVEISWWRVCLDEAQMVESGVSHAAQVARLIPRVNAWAVTGTPVQRSIEDLYGLLVFLRQDPWCASKSTWEKLCFRQEWFGGVFRELALRHTKDIVHEEIRLPRQHRTAISLGFSQVEEENYQRLFEQACKEMEVDLDGSPLRGEWNPESEETRSRMRTWLGRLRQTCVHPQVGAWNRRALGTGGGTLRTVDEVLEAIIQQNTTSVKQDQRAMFLLVAARAQVLSEAFKNPQASVDLLTGSLNALETVVEECRKDVEVEDLRWKAERVARKEKEEEKEKEKENGAQSAEKVMHPPDIVEDEYTENHDRIKETWEESDDEDEVKDDGSSSMSELNKLKNRLRDILEVLHVFHFYIGSAYFNLKDVIPEDDEEHRPERTKLEGLETAHYGVAQQLRKELMSEFEDRVIKLIDTIEKRTEQQDFVTIPDLDIRDQKGGIESSSIVEDIQFLAEKLNEQAEVLDEWREKLIQILRLPLIDQDQAAEDEGDELQQSTEHQDQGFIYVALLKTVIADRTEALTGFTSGLAAAEIKTAELAAKRQDENHQVLFEQLKAQRDDVKPLNMDGDIGAGTSALQYSMKGLVAKLRKLANPTREGVAAPSSRAKAEAGLVNETLKKLQPLIAEQEKALKELEKEKTFLSEAFNARMDFYRHLQTVSDMVEVFDEEKALKANHVRGVEALQVKYTNEIKGLSDRIGKSKSKGRFLQHLQETQGESQRLCIICQDPVQIGVLTVCGHQFCQECMDAWYRNHPSCPVCKKHLRKVDLHPVTYKLEEIRIEKESKNHDDPSTSNIDSHGNGIEIYTGMDEDIFKQIKTINLRNSFGSKIDMVIRHLLWIRRNNGGKSVVFSQWKEVLDVFQRALDGNGIGFSSLEEKRGLNRFKSDEKIEVFLLHAKSQSAGLTLVAGSNVFLVEPLVNTGLEVQAIARVHRIGQKRETNVFLYVIGGTVEEGVWRNSTKRRVEMLEEGSPTKKRKAVDDHGKGKKRAKDIEEEEEEETEDLEMQLETVNSLQLQEGAVSSMVERGQGGGEIVDNEQLWGCLFGVKRKDRNIQLAETKREEIANAREEGRGNLVDDSAAWVGPATMNLQARIRVAEDDEIQCREQA